MIPWSGPGGNQWIRQFQI